jgi:hypothetical protein
MVVPEDEQLGETPLKLFLYNVCDVNEIQYFDMIVIKDNCFCIKLIFVTYMSSKLMYLLNELRESLMELLTKILEM